MNQVDHTLKTENSSELRELTNIDIENVSGGVLPLVLGVGAAWVLAIVGEGVTRANAPSWCR